MIQLIHKENNRFVPPIMYTIFLAKPCDLLLTANFSVSWDNFIPKIQ